MNNVVLCPHIRRDPKMEAAVRVEKILEEAGIGYTVCPADSVDNLDAEGVDAVITFGGDGTILKTARAVAGLGIPILGINLGHKGFIAELEAADTDRVRDFIDGRYEIEKRMMLDAVLERDGVTVYSGYALNDVAVGGMVHALSITAYGDGGKICSFSGDGIIAATPTGSTAYSMSAGGPIVEPETKCIIVTPVCPHTMLARPYVLAPNRVVTIEMGDITGKTAFMASDGTSPVALASGDIIRVTRSELTTDLIRITGQSFYRKVSEKLGDSA